MAGLERIHELLRGCVGRGCVEFLEGRFIRREVTRGGKGTVLYTGITGHKLDEFFGQLLMLARLQHGILYIGHQDRRLLASAGLRHGRIVADRLGAALLGGPGQEPAARDLEGRFALEKLCVDSALVGVKGQTRGVLLFSSRRNS